MAGIAALIFKEDNLIGDIKIDVFIKERAKSSVRVTTNPVQSGAPVNDHIIPEPMTFYLEGVVSNASTSIIGQFENVVSNLPGQKTRAQETWAALLELQSKGETIVLQQNLMSYKDIILQNLEVNQDKSTANSIWFTADFIALNLVGAKLASSQDFGDAETGDAMSPSVNGGLKGLGGV